MREREGERRCWAKISMKGVYMSCRNQGPNVEGKKKRGREKSKGRELGETTANVFTFFFAFFEDLVA